MKLLVKNIFEILVADLPYEEEEKLLVERAEKMNSIVAERSKYYIAHFPKREVESRWQLIVANEYDELLQGMAIKEGVNMYETENGFCFTAYYGNYSEDLYLYPISEAKAKELRGIIDNAEFDESIVIDAEIAQYMY